MTTMSDVVDQIAREVCSGSIATWDLTCARLPRDIRAADRPAFVSTGYN
jgi:hypothetical protein